MCNMPEVSIIVPTYKRPKYLRRLLESIVKQTYRDYEIIIIDDCSPDIEEYNEVIREYGEQIDFITFIRNKKNYGTPTHARNVGMYMARGKYIAFCDDDDEWYPDKLRMQIQKFEESDIEYGIVYTWADTVDEESGEIIYKYRGEAEGKCLRQLLRKDFIPTSSVMVRREALLKVGGMDERMTFCCEDWDTWVRMLKSGVCCGVVKEVLLKYYRRNGECFSMSPQIYKGYLQFYRKHLKYVLLRYPIVAFFYLKHLLSIFIRQKIRRENIQ